MKSLRRCACSLWQLSNKFRDFHKLGENKKHQYRLLNLFFHSFLAMNNGNMPAVLTSELRTGE
jgi:hypothetical protein